MPEANAVRQKCPLCSGEKIEIYISATGGALAADSLGSSRINVSYGKILRCRSCRFVFSEFRPADEELHTLYRAMDPTVYEKEMSGRRQTAERHLKMMERYISTGNLVDVGCASGSFLAAAVAAGWVVTGVEPSKVLASHAKEALRGHGEVHCSTLQEANLVSASFDALTLWDVLEHVTDSVSFLGDCVRLLKPGGYLFANVPDISSIQARLLGKRWPLLLAEHLNYFDRDTLKLCGEKAGLRWVAFNRRPASFTLEYILFRLSQHRIPASAFGHRMVQRNLLGNVNIPIYLGETFVVWTRS
jgi:2-polyprenyl-3-methyl-5-hydroxy-6-metoxy-1,4-benzoquinol methylase